MRIVAHNGATIWGGAERATAKLLSGLQARGHDVTLLCNSSLVKDHAEREGVSSEILVIGGDHALHHAFRVRRRLESLRPDAFLISTYKKLFLAGLGARMARVPRTVVRVGLESDTPRSVKYRFALRRWIDAVAVNSMAMAAPFANLPGFGSSRVTVIHNGVITPSVSGAPATIRRELGIPAASFLIGTVGRLAKQKRIDRLVEVVSMLPDDVHCAVAGDGTRRAEIESAIDQRNVRSRFHLAGHRDDVGDFISSLDVYVVSSDAEGLSNSMLEAMALGKPVVSTRVSGSGDALAARQRDDAAGIITDFRASPIADAVMQLKADPGLKDRLGNEGASRARGHFSFEKMLDRWEAFLGQQE